MQSIFRTICSRNTRHNERSAEWRIGSTGSDEHNRRQPRENQPYREEKLLPQFLAQHADPLAGDQMRSRHVAGSSCSARWRSRTRTLRLSDSSNKRWSLDHLLLDQEGIPTLVEVKRSSDTRARREVVAQMLDYAANAVLYWPLEKIQAGFERTCEDAHRDPTEVLLEFLDEQHAMDDEERDLDAFWQAVKTNLEAERVRIVFVSDSISSKLQRIVEFLNSQMNPAEVIAVEIKQYVGEGLRTFVPRFVGQTAEARRRKSATGEKRQWNEEMFLAELTRQKGEAAAAIARQLLAWAKQHADEIQWGQGPAVGNFICFMERGGHEHRLFRVNTRGRVYLAARPSQDVVVAGHQKTTAEWWQRRTHFHLVVSQIVLDEAAAGDRELAQQRLDLIEGLPLLSVTDDAVRFGESLIEADVIPRVAAQDALHVALAITHGIDYLVTWNCRHIANAFIRPRIERAARDAGLMPTIICTPEELLDV